MDLNGRDAKDIEEMAENVLSKIMEAADKNTPKISYRRLRHSGMTLIKDLMNVASRIRVLLLREETRIRWGLKEDEMWRNLILKADLEKDPLKFWKEIKRMKGTR